MEGEKKLNIICIKADNIPAPVTDYDVDAWTEIPDPTTVTSHLAMQLVPRLSVGHADQRSSSRRVLHACYQPVYSAVSLSGSDLIQQFQFGELYTHAE